ncbi:MAG: SNF2 helicase-associated domain-containing protein [Paludibacter sp.]|jgi:non-specific serine/threonine protein kinase|nr:SNF2 helicase-associated domain-containing protein [Paludibacter sp.]
MKTENFKTTAIYTENGFIIEKALSDDKIIFNEKLHKDLAENPYKTLYQSAFLKLSDLDGSVLFLVKIAESFVEQTAKNAELEITRTAPEPDGKMLMLLLRETPYVFGCEFVNLLWLKVIYSKIAEIFNTEIADYKGTIEDYFKSKDENLNASGRVYFHLVEHKGEDYSFAFMATYATGDKNKIAHKPLKNALEELKNQEELLKLLSTVSRASDKSEFISELVESGELFSPLMFTPEEAYIFLKETPIYEDSGITCRIPNFWKKKYNTRLKVSAGKKEPSVVGLDAVVAFAPEIYLGDEVFSRDEIKKLLSETSGLSYLKGKWVELDREKLQAVLSAFDKFDGENMSLTDVIRLQSGLSQTDVTEGENADIIEISNGQWLETVRKQMLEPAKIKKRK